jgi:HAD superfamily phosphatase (TIGR01668 family)
MLLEKLFKPDLKLNSIFSVDTLILKEKGIKAILLDLDNTLLPKEGKRISKYTLEKIKQLKLENFKIALASNNISKERLKDAAAYLDVIFVSFALKPFPWRLKNAVKLLGVKAKETAIIGDQLFTDVVGGNLLGLLTILVKPVSEETFFLRKLLRRLENKILERLLV